MLKWWKNLTVRGRQWIVAAVALAIVVTLAVTETGPFSWELPSASEDDGFFEALLGERYTLGLVRLGLIALGLFIVVSVPALVVAGRWLKSFSKEGLTADDAAEANETIGELQSQVAELTEQRDRLAEVATQAQLGLTATRRIFDEALRMVAGQGASSPASEEGDS